MTIETQRRTSGDHRQIQNHFSRIGFGTAEKIDSSFRQYQSRFNTRECPLVTAQQTSGRNLWEKCVYARRRHYYCHPVADSNCALTNTKLLGLSVIYSAFTVDSARFPSFHRFPVVCAGGWQHDLRPQLLLEAPSFIRSFFDWRIGLTARLHFLTRFAEESTELACDNDTSYPSVDIVPMVPVYIPVDTSRARHRRCTRGKTCCGKRIITRYFVSLWTEKCGLSRNCYLLSLLILIVLH